MARSLTGKIALVTGASRGIGYAVARLLAREGAHVIAVARTAGALEELDDEIQRDGGSATLVPLDLKDGPGIDRMGGAVAERWGRLDILIGNAAILGTLSPLGHIKPKIWDELLAINVTANWRLIRSFEPLLRAAPHGRAVFVTTSPRIKAYWGGYAITKAALEAMAKTFAAECAQSTVRVNLINPGATRTAMRAQAMPGEDPSTLPTPDDVATAFLDLLRDDLEMNGEVVSYKSPLPA